MVWPFFRSVGKSLELTQPNMMTPCRESRRSAQRAARCTSRCSPRRWWTWTGQFVAQGVLWGSGSQWKRGGVTCHRSSLSVCWQQQTNKQREKKIHVRYQKKRKQDPAIILGSQRRARMKLDISNMGCRDHLVRKICDNGVEYCAITCEKQKRMLKCT